MSSPRVFSVDNFLCSAQMAMESSKKPRSATIENREKKDYAGRNGCGPMDVKGMRELTYTIDQQQR